MSLLLVHHSDKAANHLLGSIEVGNHTIAQRADGFDVLVSFAVHHTRLLANGNHLLRIGVNGHNRRLVNHNLIVVDND